MSFTPLQRRTFTALLLAPPAIAAVLLLPTTYFGLFLMLILVIGAWEWAALSGITSQAGRVGYAAVTAAAVVLLWLSDPGRWMLPVLAVLALWWVGSALYLLGLGEIEPAEGLTPWLLPTGLVVLLGLWLAVVHLHGHSERGPELVLFLMLLIWTADTAAFFTGRRWGKTKLAPIISPGKTWAGVYGALVGAAAAGLLLSWWLSLSSVLTAVAVMICVVTAFVSVVGDLYESLVKRRRGVKDSGRLLPGHGGMLDRIDSLTAAAPVFTLGVLWLEAYL